MNYKIKEIDKNSSKMIDLYQMIVKYSENTSFFNNYYWIKSYEDYGVKVRLFLILNENDISEGAFSIIEYSIFKYLKWGYIPHGPFFLNQEFDNSIFDLIQAEGKLMGYLFLNLNLFESKDKDKIRFNLLSHMDKFDLNYININKYKYHDDLQNSEIRELISPVDQGQIIILNSNNELLKQFKERTTRYIKKTMKDDNISIVKIINSNDLLICEKLLNANSERINIKKRDIKNILKYWLPAIQDKSMFGNICFYKNIPVAFVLCTLGGNKVTYSSGGIDRNFEIENSGIRPAHLLQYLCMLEAKELGYKYYDLSSVVGGGVGQFKASFNPLCFELVNKNVIIYNKFFYKIINSVLLKTDRYKREIALVLKIIRLKR